MQRTLAMSWMKMQPQTIDLVDRHYDEVWNFCRRRVGPDWASDTTQDAFLVVHRNLKRFRGESDIRTWIFGIALNCCRATLRRRRSSDPLDMLAWEALGSGEGESDLIDSVRLREALGKLDDKHRDVVILHEIDGFTYAEIAQVLDIPEGTVKSRLHHAFIQLRRTLDPKGERYE